MKIDREINIRLCDFVDVIGPGIQCDVLYDLDDLSIVVTGRLYGAQLSLTDMAPLTCNLCGKSDGGIRLRVIRTHRCGWR